MSGSEILQVTRRCTARSPRSVSHRAWETRWHAARGPTYVSSMGGQHARSNPASRGEPARGLGHYLIHVAPCPALGRLEGNDERVACRVKVLRGVAAGRVVAATDVAASEAKPQVDPALTDFQALFAAIGAWRDRVEVEHVVTLHLRPLEMRCCPRSRPCQTGSVPSIRALEESAGRRSEVTLTLEYPEKATRFEQRQ